MTPEMFLAFSKSILDLVTEMIKGQPPDVKKQLWEWYVADMKWWRNFLKIDVPK